MNEQSVSMPDVTETEQDYISAINELKQNSVRKEQYEKLREENKRLLDTLVSGGQLEIQADEELVDVEGIRKELFSGELNNLEYASKALELRDALIEKGEPDPFLAYGARIMPTAEDIDAANRVAEVLRSCIDYSDGNSEIFTNELQRVMVDSAPMSTNRKRY